jgi:hypothetical protein
MERLSGIFAASFIVASDFAVITVIRHDIDACVDAAFHSKQ